MAVSGESQGQITVYPCDATFKPHRLHQQGSGATHLLGLGRSCRAVGQRLQFEEGHGLLQLLGLTAELLGCGGQFFRTRCILLGEFRPKCDTAELICPTPTTVLPRRWQFPDQLCRAANVGHHALQQLPARSACCTPLSATWLISGRHPGCARPVYEPLRPPRQSPCRAHPLVPLRWLRLASKLVW